MVTNSKTLKSAPSQKNFSQVFSRFVHSATPGFVVGLIVVLWSLVEGAGGPQAAAHDLLAHAVLVHPFLLSFVSFVTYLSITLQGADVFKVLDRWFTLPILEFFSHLFPVGVGIFLPLVFTSGTLLGTQPCGRTLNAVVVLAALVTMGLISIAGCFIVESRVAFVRNPKSPNAAEKATLGQLAVFAILAAFSGWCLWRTVGMSQTTEEIVAAYIAKGDYVGANACKLMGFLN